MGYYLLDHPPASRQFYPSRANQPTWAVGVHTVEAILDRIAPDMGAENTAGFISRRTDPGSYSEIVDLDSVITMVPDDYTSFSVAQSGYNSRTWNIAMACRVDDLDADDPLTRLLIATVGQRIAAFWARRGVDIAAAARWGGTDALRTACLFNHGDVQPADRTDAWAKHPHRGVFDAWLVHDILWHAGLADGPEPPEEDMPITDDDLHRICAALSDPEWNPGTIIDKGARDALGAVHVGVNDPTSGTRALVLQILANQAKPDTVDVPSLAAAIVDSLGGELASEVSLEIGKRLTRPSS